MSPADILSCIICAMGISAGQVLFKLASNRLTAEGSVMEPRFLMILAASFLVYGLASIYWMWVLRRVPLSQAYMLLATTYILVPLSASLLFGETIRPMFWLGVAFIGVGVWFTTQ